MARGRHAQRRRPPGRRLLLGALAAVLVVGGAAAAVTQLGGVGGGDQKPTAQRTAAPQQTLLVMLRADDRSAAASALLAHSAKRQAGLEVLVPQRVIADVPGYGAQPFARALALPGGAKTARATLADLMGIRVDATWVLEPAAFQKLVDTLGGVDVDVDTDVLTPKSGGGSTVAIPHGRQHLDGAQALAYATYLGPDEKPTDQLVRVQTVLDAVLTALARSSGTADVIAALGPGSTSEWAAPTLAAFVQAFVGDVRSQNVFYTNLPVVPLDSTGGAPSYRIDSAKLLALVDRELSEALPPGGHGDGRRVLVENAVGTPGLGVSVRDRLVKAGYRFVESRNLQPFGRAQSVVLVFEDTPQATQRGAAVAKALGLPESAVRFSPRQQSVADIVVILGKDYRP